jgi:hypothetical protein
MKQVDWLEGSCLYVEWAETRVYHFQGSRRQRRGDDSNRTTVLTETIPTSLTPFFGRLKSLSVLPVLIASLYLTKRALLIKENGI